MIWRQFLIKKTHKWNELIKSRYALAGNGYLNYLIEYYNRENSFSIKYCRNESVLFYALRSKSLDIVKYIIEELHYDYNTYGCYINNHSRSEIEYNGYDLLYISSKYSNLEIVKYIDLLKYNNNSNNSNKSIDNSWNYSVALQIAPLSKDFEVLRFIYNKIIDSQQKLEEYQLRIAISNALSIDRGDMVHWLISQANIKIDLIDSVYLNSAIKSGSTETLEYCLESTLSTTSSGCIDYENLIDQSSILHAIKSGHLEMIQWLHSKNILSKIIFRKNPLIKAAEYNHWDMVYWLYFNFTHCFDKISTNRRLIQLASINNRLDIIQMLLSELNNNNSLISKVTSKSIDLAAKAGNIEIIKWLSKNVRDDQDGFGCATVLAMNYAARKGHFEVLRWLHENRSEGCTESAMDLAAGKGYLDIVQWLHYNRTEGCTSYAMIDAAQSGHLDVVQWLYDNRTEGCEMGDVNTLARNGNLNAIKWFFDDNRQVQRLHPHENNSSKGYYFKIMDDAANSGNVELMKFLHEYYENQKRHQEQQIPLQHQQNKQRQKPEEICTKEAMNWGILENHFEMVKFLHFNRTEGCTSHAIDWAALNGNIDLMKWLQENRTERCTNNIRRGPARHGNLTILKWLNENNLGNSTRLQLITDAANGGHLNVIKWLFDEYTDQPDTSTKTLFSNQNFPMDLSARHGHIEVLKYLHGKLKTDTAMDMAANHGNLDILNWLHENYNTVGCTSFAMDSAAGRGHYEIVKWLHNNRTEGCTSDAIDNAANAGHLKIVKWLHHNRTEGCTSEAMDYAAESGHLEMVKWLHENRTEGCTINAIDNAAGKGHFEVIQWLFDNRTEGCTSEAMGKAAKKGHVNILKLLIDNTSIGAPPIAYNNAVKWCQLDVMKWLHRNRTEGFKQNSINIAKSKNVKRIINWLTDNHIIQ